MADKNTHRKAESEVAVSHGGFCVELAGRRLTITGDQSLESIRSAFASVEPVASGAGGASLEIATAADPAGVAPWRELAAGVYAGADGSVAVVHRNPSTVECFVPGTPSRLALIASRAALESGDLRAHPGHHAISSWLASPTMRTLHAAAVSLGGRGVLFLGVGGRGKTTTSLACARAGFSFMGDDLCTVEAGNSATASPPLVHGLFATAKLNVDSRMRLDARNWTELGKTPIGKTVVRLPDEIEFSRSSPLAAIIAVRAGLSPRAETKRLDPRDAFRLLILAARQGTTSSAVPTQWFSAAASLAREVPAFELSLTWDLDRVTAAVRTVLEQ